MKKIRLLIILIFIQGLTFAQADIDSLYRHYSKLTEEPDRLNDSLSREFIVKAQSDFKEGKLCYSNLFGLHKRVSTTGGKILKLNYGINECNYGNCFTPSEFEVYTLFMVDLIKSKYGKDFFNIIQSQADSLDKQSLGYKNVDAKINDTARLFNDISNFIKKDTSLSKYNFCIVSGNVDTASVINIDNFYFSFQLWFDKAEKNIVGKHPQSEINKLIENINVTSPAYFKGRPITSIYLFIIDLKSKTVELYFE